MKPIRLTGIVLSLALSGSIASAEPSASDKAPSEVQWGQIQTLFSPAPQYPAKERKAGASGEAVVVVTVAADGSVREVRIEQSQPVTSFGAAAAEAVSEWKFNPESKNGMHAPFIVRITLNFMAATD